MENTKEKQYLIKVKPNTNNKKKWYYGRNNMTDKEFKVMDGIGDFENRFVIQTKGGSGGTYHFDKDDVEIIEVLNCWKTICKYKNNSSFSEDCFFLFQFQFLYNFLYMTSSFYISPFLQYFSISIQQKRRSNSSMNYFSIHIFLSSYIELFL